MPDRSAFSLKKGIIGRLSVAPLLGTGFLSIGGTLTADRTATFPDAAIIVAGSAVALTSGRVPFVTTGGLLVDSARLTYSDATPLLIVTSAVTTETPDSRAVNDSSVIASVRAYGSTVAGTLWGVATANASGFIGFGTPTTSLLIGTSGSSAPIVFGINVSEVFRITAAAVTTPLSVTVSSTLSATSLTATGLTAGGIPYISTGGLLAYDSKLRFTAAVSGVLRICGDAVGQANNYFSIKNPTVQIVSGDATNENTPGSLLILTTSVGLAGNRGAEIYLGSSRSTSTQLNAGTFTAVQANNNIGGVYFTGDNGVSLRGAGASIVSYATETWSATARGAHIEISAVAAGSAVVAPVILIQGAVPSSYSATRTDIGAGRIMTAEIGLGFVPSAGAGLLQLASGTTIANGILLGDVGIFRNAANAVTINATAGITTTGGRLVKTRSVVSAAATTTLDGTDHAAILTGTTTQTFTLPAAAAGRQLFIKNRSTGALTVNRAGADTIDGLTTLNVASGSGVLLVANGTDWVVL